MCSLLTASHTRAAPQPVSPLPTAPHTRTSASHSPCPAAHVCTPCPTAHSPAHADSAATSAQLRLGAAPEDVLAPASPHRDAPAGSRRRPLMPCDASRVGGGTSWRAGTTSGGRRKTCGLSARGTRGGFGVTGGRAEAAGPGCGAASDAEGPWPATGPGSSSGSAVTPRFRAGGCDGEGRVGVRGRRSRGREFWGDGCLIPGSLGSSGTGAWALGGHRGSPGQ